MVYAQRLSVRPKEKRLDYAQRPLTPKEERLDYAQRPLTLRYTMVGMPPWVYTPVYASLPDYRHLSAKRTKRSTTLGYLEGKRGLCAEWCLSPPVYPRVLTLLRRGLSRLPVTNVVKEGQRGAF